MKKSDFLFKSTAALLIMVLAAAVFGCNNNVTPLENYALTYDGNGATSGTVPAEKAVYSEGEKVTVLGNTNNLAKTDYSFKGWNTDPNGNGTSYSAGSTVLMDSGDVTLYADWSSDIELSIALSGENNYTAESSFTVRFSFTKEVTGFEIGDITVTNGSISNFDGSGTTYTADIAAVEEGDVIITAAAEAAMDSDGFTSKETTCTIIYDKTAPESIEPEVAAIGGGQLVISWNGPSEADDPSFDHVLVSYNSSEAVAVDKGTTSYTFSGLETGVSYCPLLVAVDAAGNKSALGEGYSVTLYDDTLRTVYIIDSASELAAMSDDLNGCYIIHSDITLSAWTPVGSSSTPFTGIIDGGDHQISGMNVSRGSYSGLLGYASSAWVFDLSIDGSLTTLSSGNSYFGLLAGYWLNGTMENVSVSGTVGTMEVGHYFGGLVGCINGGAINSCFSSAVVSGYDAIGGLAGSSKGTSTISFSAVRSSSSTAISGKLYIGGMLGYMQSGTLSISQCFTDITVTTGTSLGDNAAGLCGRIAGTLTVDNCYTVGNVTCNYTSCVGGLFGYSSGMVYCTDSYARGKITGDSYEGALYGFLSGSGASTSGNYYSTNTGCSSARGSGSGSETEIDDASMADIISLGGWDTEIWSVSDGYPYLVNNPYTF